jgi:hypothetical protein
MRRENIAINDENKEDHRIRVVPGHGIGMALLQAMISFCVSDRNQSLDAESCIFKAVFERPLCQWI